MHHRQCFNNTIKCKSKSLIHYSDNWSDYTIYRLSFISLSIKAKKKILFRYSIIKYQRSSALVLKKSYIKVDFHHQQIIIKIRMKNRDMKRG